jgi:oligopeptide/dipeptide ABC transporter ATP-binding protein
VSAAPQVQRPEEDGAASADPLLEARGVTKLFAVRGRGVLGDRGKKVHAVDDVSLAIRPGEIVGVVGETGSGKTTLGRLLLRLMKPSSGEILFEGRDVDTLDRAGVAAFRRAVQCVFQNPYSSLSPRRQIRKTIAEPLEFLGEHVTPEELRRRVALTAEAVGISDAMLERYPHELSGGQRQRVAIARATVTSPSCIVLDEPVSALDLSIQAQVLNLLADLHAAHGMAYVFIAHNLAIVRHFCERVVVMYLGKVVETTTRERLYSEPLHPYTQALLASVIVVGPQAREQTFPALGELPSPLDPPPGCPFSSRCPAVMDVCRGAAPPLVEAQPGHWVACHLHTR